MATFDVNNQVRKVQSTANGSVTDFSFAFQVNATSDIQVYVDNVLQTETTHYSIINSSAGAGLNTNGTGTVRFGTAPANGKTVAIKSDVPIGRTSVYTAGGNITAASLEDDFDTIEMKLGDGAEALRRVVIAPVGDPDNVSMTLPTKANRLGKVLAFNATTGNPEAGPDIADVSTVAAASADIQTVAHLQDGTTATNAVSTVAGKASEITSVAAKASLLTSDFVSDLNTVAVTDVINDINTLATSDIVSDLNTLATSDFVADLNLMATSANVTALNNVSGSITNVNEVANNLGSVNNFGERYRVSATAPTTSLDVGDLWFDSTNDVMKVYGASGFVNAGSSVNGTSNREDYIVGTASGSYTGSTTVFPITYDAGFIDVYQNGVKLQPADFTATNGTSVVLGTAAATNDTVSLVAFGTFNVANFSITAANDVANSLGSAGQVLK